MDFSLRKKVRNKSMLSDRQTLFTQLLRTLIRSKNGYSWLFSLNTLNTHFYQYKNEGETIGILKDLIDQIEEEYGSGAMQFLPPTDVQEPKTPLPVVVATGGRELAWSNDPPFIRVYAWALQTLRFLPVDDPTGKIFKIPSGEMDRIRLRKLARDLRMTEREVQEGLDHLVKEGDLMFKTERSRRIYFLAPLRY